MLMKGMLPSSGFLVSLPKAVGCKTSHLHGLNDGAFWLCLLWEGPPSADKLCYYRPERLGALIQATQFKDTCLHFPLCCVVLCAVMG